MERIKILKRFLGIVTFLQTSVNPEIKNVLFQESGCSWFCREGGGGGGGGREVMLDLGCRDTS